MASRTLHTRCTFFKRTSTKIPIGIPWEKDNLYDCKYPIHLVFLLGFTDMGDSSFANN